MTIKVEFSLDVGFRNIVEDRLDAGVRLGESVEKDMIAVRIGPDVRLIAVASPSYFAQHSPPEHPRDLVRHTCINLRQERVGKPYDWEFSRGGPELHIKVDGQLTYNTTLAMIDAAESGFGIAYVPESIVTDKLASGALVLVLSDWSPKFEGYHIIRCRCPIRCRMGPRSPPRSGDRQSTETMNGYLASTS